MKCKKRFLTTGILLSSMLLVAGCGVKGENQGSQVTDQVVEQTVDPADNQTDNQVEVANQDVDQVAKQTAYPVASQVENQTVNQTVLQLDGHTATINGETIKEYDYTWHISPDNDAEWYEGTEPEGNDAVYIAHDIWYYPELEESGFSKENYDGEMEWVYHYSKEGLTDYLFSTLPVLGESLPTEMMHSEEEAYDNPVLHITQSGTYVLQGEWHGQIKVDLEDEEATTNENAKVTLMLNGVTITCDCGPGIYFSNVYECDGSWEEEETHTGDVNTENSGANVWIADGTINNVTGANVYRLLKAEYKKNSTTVQKKAHKLDGAFYSCQSMNIGGNTGILNITSTTYEGLDSELHLTINGGFINIYSQDDAINVNEDNVSVFTMNDGTLHIFAGLGAEGDGIDSNGFITVNGGTIAGGTPSGSDSLLDADCEIQENGGNIIVIGSSQATGFGGPNGMGKPGGMGKPDGMMPFDGKERPEGNQGFGDGERPEGMTPPGDGERPEGMTLSGEVVQSE